MIDLLLDHSIFAAVKSGYQNHHQLSGRPPSRDNPLPFVDIVQVYHYPSMTCLRTRQIPR